MIAVSATPPFLVEGAALLVAAAAIAYICYRVGLMPIIGFLVAGVVIGPHGLGAVSSRELIDAVAEVGVILLLFTIGLEFSLERLARITTLILGGGSLQVGLASVATMAALLVIGVDWRAGLFTGFLVALSSTAIVLKLFADRGETNSRQGQVALGLLIFQDLAVIVMVLVVPMLGGGHGDASALAIALGKAVALIVVVLLVARRLMPPLLERVARTCSPELFLLAVTAICFGTAFLTSLAGVSVSLGAFLGGLIVSESQFREHAFTEIMPLQILFSATFFVSVGMLLDVGFVLAHLPAVIAAVLFVLAIKVITTGASVAALGYEAPVATYVGMALAQVGEFSFVLERAGRDVGLSPAGMGEAGSQSFIAATVLLMIATPFLTGAGAKLARRLEGKRAIREAETLEEAIAELPAEHAPLTDHVIVAGYGEAARQLVRVLHGCSIPYVITTLSPGGAAEAEADGLPVIRGDAAKQLTLLHAGAGRARMIVIADDDPATAHRISTIARTIAPDSRIVVRTRYVAEVDTLSRAGADRVIAEELESIVQLFAEVLRNFQIAPEEIERHEATIRSGGYAALRQETVPNEPVARRDAFASEGMGAMRRIDTQHQVTLKTHVSKAACSHLDQIRPVFPSAPGCEECLRMGDDWVHLRICMTCGHVGCCDSSRNRHASKHHDKTSHPIVRSLEPGEDWGWCFADEITV